MADNELDIPQNPLRETRIRKLTFEQRQEIITRALAGESAGKLAQEFGVARSRIGKMMTDYRSGQLHLAPSPERIAREAAKAPKTGKHRNGPAIPIGKRPAIIERIVNGETHASVAQDFGVTRAYISLLYRKHRDGTLRTSGSHVRGPAPAPMLTDEEMARLYETVRDHYPEKFGLRTIDDPEIGEWTPRRIQALCEQLFQKRPAYYKPWVKQLIRDARHETQVAIGWEPTPVLDERRFTPEQLADTEFMEWVRSPVAQRIREREFDAWLREKNQRDIRLSQERREFEAAQATEAAETPQPRAKKKNTPAPTGPPVGPPASDPDFRREVEALEAAEAGLAAPGQRVGKHAKNRAHPAAKKKKRKK